MPRKNPETAFKELVAEDLKTIKDIWFSKIQQVAIRGTPDFLVCLRGKFIAMELKVDSPLTLLQKYNLKRIEKSGGEAMVVTPDNWKEIFQYLKGKK